MTLIKLGIFNPTEQPQPGGIDSTVSRYFAVTSAAAVKVLYAA